MATKPDFVPKDASVKTDTRIHAVDGAQQVCKRVRWVWRRMVFGKLVSYSFTQWVPLTGEGAERESNMDR